MTYLIAAYLLTQIGLGFVWHRSIRDVNERADQTRADHEQVSADNARLRTMLASAEADAIEAQDALAEAGQRHDDQAILLTVACAEVERYSTALRGELTRQVRQEVLRPDERAERPVTAGVVPIRKRGGR